MTEEQINEIQSLFYSGMKKADIARKTGCPIGNINYYTSGRYYKVKTPNHKRTELARERIIYKKESFTKVFMIFYKNTKNYRFMRSVKSFLINRNCMIKIETVLYRIFCKENTKGIFRLMFFKQYVK